MILFLGNVLLDSQKTIYKKKKEFYGGGAASQTPLTFFSIERLYRCKYALKPSIRIFITENIVASIEYNNI